MALIGGEFLLFRQVLDHGGAVVLNLQKTIHEESTPVFELLAF